MTTKKKATEIAAGDLICWAGSDGGATVTAGWDGTGFEIEWTSTIVDFDGNTNPGPHRARLSWSPDNEVCMEER